jgi:hypothetical protein
MRPAGHRDQTKARTCRPGGPSRPSRRRSSRPPLAHAQSPAVPSSSWPGAPYSSWPDTLYPSWFGVSEPPNAAPAVLASHAALYRNCTSRLACVQSHPSKQVFQHGARTRATKSHGASKTPRYARSAFRSLEPQTASSRSSRSSANIDRSESQYRTSRRTSPWPSVALVLPLCCEAVHTLSMVTP